MSKTKIYFWLKIDKKFFDNLFIKRLKNLPGGYTMMVIYIRLMLESLESDCILYYEGYFNNLKEELALKLDVSEDDIDMTMAYFTKCGLIQIDEDKNAEMQQAKAMVMSETNWANYKREQRKKVKLEEVKPSLTFSNSSLTEIEKEKEIDKDIELEVNEESINQAAEITEYYQQRIGVIDGQQYQILADYLSIDGMELEVIKTAIDKAADNSKRSFAYINSILKTWRQNGIKTMVQVKEEQTEFHKKQTEPITREEWMKTRSEENPF